MRLLRFLPCGHSLALVVVVDEEGREVTSCAPTRLQPWELLQV